MIDQQDYQLLKTIGEQGSVQRAASAIGVSWPSVSKRLAKIEGKLNVRLFERRRGRNGVLPLPVLSRILAEYEYFSQTMSQVIKEASEEKDNQRPEIIRLGVATTIGKADIERALSIVGRLGEVAITDMPVETALADLEKGAVDVALLAEPSYPSAFKPHLVSVDPFQVAFPVGHRFENQNSIQLSELDDEAYINRALCEFPRYFAEQTKSELPEDDNKDDGPHNITNEVVAQIMIKEGYGVAVIPESLVVVQGLKTRALVRPTISRKIALVTRSNSLLPADFLRNGMTAQSPAS